MKKFINRVDDYLHESLMGFARAHQDLVEYNPDPRYLLRKQRKAAGKVVLISGGGAGHEPLHAGFVGAGMLDAACPGEVFTSPTPDQMLMASQALNPEAGVLFIVKNYAGDVMNFEIAAEMLETEHATVLVTDDVSLPKDHPIGRRGVAGTLMVEKIVGAAAEQGRDLVFCTQLAQRVNAVTASMGVALTSCTVPALGKPTFELGGNDMEIGVGIHGEHGRETVPLKSANAIVDQIGCLILDDLQPPVGSELLLHVNGFGGTPASELYLIYHAAAELLAKKGHVITRSLVGNFTTSLDMAGCSITLTVLDDELKSLWDAPVQTAALHWSY